MPTVGTTSKPAYIYDAGTDTWVPVGVGAHTHAYIPNTLVDNKGDLVTATANDVPAILSKGADGTVLVSDSTTQTGLAWQPYAPTFVAGKNKLINGDFNINQRNFTSVTTDGTYTFDRWRLGRFGNGTSTATPQTFTPGSAPVSGYESRNFLQIVTSGQSGTAFTILDHPMEDVRTLAGQTVTYSFWGKVASGTAKVAVEFFQDFGSGGSSFNNVGGSNVTLTTSWTRHSITYTMPSIVGKTVGANSYINARLWLSASSEWNPNTGSIGLQSATFHIWGCQVEAGPIATPFTTHTGSIQGELAACQRYYLRHSYSGTNSSLIGPAYARTTGIAFATWTFPVTMRATPTLAFSNGTQYFNLSIAAGDATFNTLSGSSVANTDRASLRADAGSHTIGQAGVLGFNNSAAWIEASAEL